MILTFLKNRMFLLIFLIFGSDLSACTGVVLKARNRAVVSGRTLEFGRDVETGIAIIPRRYKFVGEIPRGRGKEYTSKYAAVGAYCFDDIKLMDGVNEKGLVAAAFYFPGYAKYTKITKKNRSKAISPIEFPNWVLTQFASIREVKAALSSVVIAPTVSDGWGSTPPPLHYIIYDRKGKSIVIEPIDGKLVVYDNLIGVITNSPTFDWHLTNLNNYVNLTAFNAEPSYLKGFKLSPFGQGSGMLGLPGDFTPPSRFVRAAFFSSLAIPSTNSDELVNQVFHILNQFDIPVGAVLSKEHGKTSFDSTLFTSVKDHSTLKYYFRSYVDQTIKFVDLKQFNLKSKVIKSMKIKRELQKNIDISSQLGHRVN